MKQIACTALGLLLAATTGHALAQALTPGTYAMEGGSYRIRIEQSDDGLLVREPNKDSTYLRQDDGSYHFYNPNTGTTYGLRVVDGRSIEAFKPFAEGGTPTRLVLLAAASSGPSAGPGSAAGDAIAGVARKYEALARSDPGNAHVWSACAAAAQSRATSNDAEFTEYVGLLMQMLRPISTTPGATPCPDAIPQALW
ncbi:MAG TPA: hypothetical protein DDZ67_02840 [Xanthomonadaceae bacterium]|nr:hypothetical protein [Xanthomonadaceae bacterium]